MRKTFLPWFRSWVLSRPALAACALVVALLVGFRLHASTHGLRYVGHPDEHFLYGQARTILTEPGLNPRFFRYPSLPIYLTAGAIQVRHWFGVEQDFDHPPRKSSKGSPPRFSSPKLRGERYEGAPLIAAARLLFAGLGAAVFGWIAVIARGAGARSLYWLTPLLLGLCGLVQLLVVDYQNVDTPTLFFTMAGLGSMLAWFESDSWVKKALVPGLLCGCAAASKYNSGLLLGSGIVAILVAPKISRRGSKIAILIGSSAAAFLLAVPYALLDFPTFRADVLFEIRHYQTGHPGYEGPAGLPQLGFYLSELAKDYGFFVSGLALLGIPLTFAKDWRRAVTLLSFPAAMLLHMSTNRVHFLRSVAPVFAVLPVYATLGAERVFEEFARRSRGRLRERAAPMALAVVMTAFLGSLVATPAQAKRLFDRNRRPDSRDEAIAWTLAATEPGATVYVARDLWLSPRDLPKRHVVLLPPALGDAENVVDRGGALLLPRYAAPTSTPTRLRRDARAASEFREKGRRRAEVANGNRERLLAAVDARCPKRWQGSKASLPRGLDEVAEPKASPEITGCLVREIPLQK